MRPDTRQQRVVLFSGGRGSGALTRQLVGNSGISLTIAINGYDDGASTGEVRRFLRDSLGPSDFRKNASRLATELRSCPAALIELLDFRFPASADEADARKAFAAVAGDPAVERSTLHNLAERVPPAARTPCRGRVEAICGSSGRDGRLLQFLGLQSWQSRIRRLVSAERSCVQPCG